jgi:hypothetical protein
MRKGLLVAALHVAIVASLGAKLLVDRATRPRVWARAVPVDPNLPIRGRYVSLRLEAALGQGVSRDTLQPIRIELSAHDGQLVATTGSYPHGLDARVVEREGERVVQLAQPLAYFIPEHVADPSRRPSGEELWVEVTIPRKGAPRPIRLGVRKNGVLTPLEMN